MKFTLSLLSVVGLASANWKSGSVSTYEKFNYGKFVTRMKAPDRKGTVSSFFTYWDGPGFYPGGWNELDIEIVPSAEDNPLSTNVIYGDGHSKLEEHDYAHGFNPHDDWHTYEMEWTPEYISFAIDGEEVRHLNSNESEAVKFMGKDQSLRMNFWTPTFHSWGQGFDPVDMPWYVLYDYVEVYTFNQHSNEFEFHWRDDFKAFDSGRWHKASGGFEANSSVFYPSNVYTSGGNMVIKMEPLETHVGEMHHGHEGPSLHGILHAKDAPHHEAATSTHMHRALEGHDDSIHGIKTDEQTTFPRHHWTEAHKYGGSHHKEALHLTSKTTTVHQDQHDDILTRDEFDLNPIHHDRLEVAATHHDAPVVHHEVAAHDQHHTTEFHADHETHHELDHHFDDQHDVEPSHLHEHAVHKATLHSVEHHTDEGARQMSHHERMQHIMHTQHKEEEQPAHHEEPQPTEHHSRDHLNLRPAHTEEYEDSHQLEHYREMEQHRHEQAQHEIVAVHQDEHHHEIAHHQPIPVRHVPAHHEVVDHHEPVHHESVRRETVHREPVHYETVRHEDVRHEDVRHEDVRHETVHHEPVYHETVRHEDIRHEPVYHEVGLLEQVHHDAHPVREEIHHEAPRHHEPVVHHESHKTHDVEYHADHDTHRSLDHEYDEQHDVEPVHFHEHAVLKAVKREHEYGEPGEHEEPIGHYYDRHYAAETVREHERPVHIHSDHERAAYYQPHQHETYWTQPHHEDVSWEHEQIHEADHHSTDRHHRQYTMAEIAEEQTGYEHSHQQARHYTHGDYYTHYDDHERRPVHDEWTPVHDQWTTRRHEIPVTHHYEAPRHEVREVRHEVRHEAPRHETREVHHYEAPRHEAREVHHYEAPRHEAREVHHEDREYSHEAPRYESHEVRHEARHEDHEIRHEAPRYETHEVRHEDHEIHHEAPYYESREIHHETPRHEEVSHHESEKHYYMPLFESEVQDHSGEEQYRVEEHHHGHLEAEFHTDHSDHHALDHEHDDQHDIEPVHFHEHAVHHAFDHPDSHSYHLSDFEHEKPRETVQYETMDLTHPQEEMEPRDRYAEMQEYEQHYMPHHEQPVIHREYYERYHDVEHHADHDSHHALDHEYDDQHDVEPVHFHEHAVHHTFEHPDSHSYHYATGAKAYDHTYEPISEHSYYDPEERFDLVQEPEHHMITIDREPYEHQSHQYVVREGDFDHHHHAEPIHFVVEEPMHEESHETFHGRELGYMYREHADAHAHGHYEYHTAEPEHGIHHGETYGSHIAGDEYEVEHGHRDVYSADQQEHFVEPVLTHETYHYGDFEHTLHYEPPQHHEREVEFEVDEQGHVHMFEERPEFMHSFLQ